MSDESHWRRRSRQVIDAVLGSLPVAASVADRRAALSAAYPFARRQGWAYKCWLKEVGIACPHPKTYRGDPTPAVLVVFSPVQVPCFYVSCGWCYAEKRRGCVACANSTADVTRLLADPEAAALLAHCADDPLDGCRAAVLADWLEERNHPFADVVRRYLSNRMETPA